MHLLLKRSLSILCIATVVCFIVGGPVSAHAAEGAPASGDGGVVDPGGDGGTVDPGDGGGTVDPGDGGIVDPSDCDPSRQLCNPLKYDNLIDLIKGVLNNIVLPIGAVIVALAFIWVGFLFVKAQGNPEQLQEAKRALWYTIIGAAILLGAWTITQVIQATVCQVAPDIPALCG